MAFHAKLFGATVAILVALALGCQPAAHDAPTTVAKEPQSVAAAQRSEQPGESSSSQTESVSDNVLAGSKSCRDCHGEFYHRWATSFHGLAMQPYTAELGKNKLTPHAGEVAIGKERYHAEIDDRGGRVRARRPAGEMIYPIEHVMGGKNVYYFLTPLERGRLQVLPLAYDVHRKAWYDMAASGVRHFPDRRDEALHWTDRMFTFNTTCFNCHVTNLKTNYDPATDSYHTTWSEPGISCESCHGPAQEHVRAMVRAEGGKKADDLKIIRTRQFTAAQTNDLCATCHARLLPLSTSFRPGDKFFDHFDLVTLEHPDYYPDGRDLGENYTFTTWLMSPCAKSGKLSCSHCHASSGQARFPGEASNQSCMPCHEQLVRSPEKHGYHAAGSPGNRCVACHMPRTRFAAMNRTDHSMRPPTPAATVAFKSPNACNVCHTDRDAPWSDTWCRQWYRADYQASTLRRAGLLDDARKGKWDRLPDMLARLGDKNDDQVEKASLVRLLASCEDERKWPVLLEMLRDPSPLVRSSAAGSLHGRRTPEVIDALAQATGDSSRLVRIRSAAALAGLRSESIPDPTVRANLVQATGELVASARARPDDWASYATLGNFYMERQEYPAAITCFETAASLEPRQIGALVNGSIAYSSMGRNDKAEEFLRRALKAEPNSAAAHFNLGLLLGETGRLAEAQSELRAALMADPQMAPAAYNLAVLLGQKSLDEAVAWCRKARQLRPAEPKYAYTLSFYLRRKGDVPGAIALLREIIRNHRDHWDAYLLLGDILEGRQAYQEAIAVYRDALKVDSLPLPLKGQLEAKVLTLRSRSSRQRD